MRKMMTVSAEIDLDEFEVDLSEQSAETISEFVRGVVLRKNSPKLIGELTDWFVAKAREIEKKIENKEKGQVYLDTTCHGNGRRHVSCPDFKDECSVDHTRPCPGCEDCTIIRKP